MSSFVPMVNPGNPFGSIVMGSGRVVPALADLDGDGDLDVLAGEVFGTFLFYRNAGTSTAPVYLGQTGANNPFASTIVGVGDAAPLFGDFDGDGDFDLVMGTGRGTLGYLRNDGNAISPVFVQDPGSDPFMGIDVGDSSIPSLGDIDGDGDLDLLVGASDGSLHFFRNTGNATVPAFAPQTGAANPFDGIGVGFAAAPSLGDIDQDGDLDLVLGETNGTLHYHLNTGTATAPAFAPQTGTANPFGAVDVLLDSIPRLADIDVDGDLDLVIAELGGTLSVFQNPHANPVPVFAALTGTANPLGGMDAGQYNTPAWGDFDSDGDLDIIVGNYDGFLSLYRNTGTATAPAFAALTGTFNPLGNVDVGFFSAPTWGDLDADGDLDLVVGENEGQLLYYRNTGTPIVAAYLQQTGSNNPFNGFDVIFNSKPSLGDIDGDGDLDLVVGNVNGVLSYFRNTGTATTPAYARQTGTDNPFDGVQVGRNSTPSLGDIDNDGDLDLVVGNADGVLNYYRNAGTVTAPAYAAQTGTDNPFDGFSTVSYSAPGLADIEGDGDLDLTVGQPDGTVLTFIHNDAPTLSQPTINLTGTDEDRDSTPVTVASLLASAGWADVDLGAPQGLAITGSTGAGWQYSLDGMTWTPVGTASATAAVLLGAGTQLRYAPDRANGETADLSFHAWDQSSGTASTASSTSTADTSHNGGSSAFSSASSTASLVVASLNDAPTLSQSAITLTGTDEDTDSPGTTVAAMLTAAGWADVDTNPLQGMAVTAASGNGQWQYSVNGSTWTPIGTVTTTAALLLGAGTQLRYSPDRINGETPTLSFLAWDQSSGTATTASGTGTADTTTNGDSTAFSVDTSTASLLVTPVNDRPVAVRDAFITDEDTDITGNVLLANPSTPDSDPDGDTLTVVEVNGSSARVGVPFLDFLGRAYITVYADGTITFAVRGAFDDFTAKVLFLQEFNYTVSDSKGGRSIGRGELVVNGRNDAPTTTPVTLDPIAEDSPALTITQAMLLKNASDADALLGLSATGLTQTGGNGTLTDLGGGQWRYLPAPNDDTDVSFSYTISDGTDTVAGSATLDLLPVNDAPTNSPVTLTPIQEDSRLIITPDQLLANAVDQDRPAQTLTVSNLQLIGNGALVPLADGTWRFVPALNDDTGVSFSYTISDGSATVAGSATLDITPINDLPTSSGPVTLTAILEDSPTYELPKAELLRNARDVDSSLSVTRLAVVFPGKGFVTHDPQGDRWLYTPAADDDTEVTFSYLGSDGEWSVPLRATLDILPVNDAPTTRPVALTPTHEDTALTITTAQLLANTADVDRPAQTLTVSNLQLTGGGSLQDNPDGSWRYTPAPNDDTGVSFSYTISDGSATVAGSATLDIVPVNDAPTTQPVVLAPIHEDISGLTITQALLLGNAADVDGPNPLQAVNLQIATGGGSLSSPMPGTWVYTPAPNDDAQVSFKYGITDGAATTPGSATLDILPVNDAPTAVADTAQTTPGTAVTIPVLVNDSDFDGGPLSVIAITQGSSGSVAIQPGGGAVRYTPNASFAGFDTFTYTAADGAGGTATASVRVLLPSYIGTPGNDVALGTQRADFMLTGDGNDRVLAYAGDDYIDGGRGADTISGGLGADTLLGGDGADTFLTTAAELAGDQIDGGGAIDTLQITDPIAPMPAAFTLVNVEQISFAGSLLVEHSAWLDLSMLSLAGTGNQITGATAATRIIGTRSADRIVDSGGNDDLRGAEGNDTIMAGIGQDTVHGGNGNDTLGGSTSTLGDNAVDTFVFNTALNALTNVDTIIGFEANSRDVIALDSSLFSAIGPTLDASEFRSGVGGHAADANDFIVFDPATGALYYDADGSGAGARIQFATLGAGLSGTVDAADFAIGAYPG